MHTPGPWVLDSDAQRDVLAGHDCGELLATAYPMKSGKSSGEAEGRANARLIAAAPDLLEALKLARTRMAHFTCEESIQVDAAIAKAEGK